MLILGLIGPALAPYQFSESLYTEDDELKRSLAPSAEHPPWTTEVGQAVLSRDFPVVQFVFFLVAAFVIIANVVVDVIYGIVEPQMSVDEG